MTSLLDRGASRRRTLRLAGAAAAVVAAASALSVVPAWLVVIVPPTAWRRASVAFLWATLIFQVALLPIALIGSALAGVSLARARRDRRPRSGAARLLLLCSSCLLGLGALEAGAAAWGAWAHRYPTLPTRFARDTSGRTASASERAIHILVVGESSALGIPYDKWLSVGSIVAWQLERVFPGRQVSVEYRARGGANLEPMHLSMADVDRRPDAVLVFSGHNEFQARYPWSREVDYYRDIAPPATLGSRLEGLGRLSNFGRLVLHSIELRRLCTAPPPKPTRRLVDVPSFTPEEGAAVVSDYRGRLAAIASYCRRIGALPILIVPPGNEAGYEPNRSVLPPGTPAAGREAFARRFAAAAEAGAREPSAGVALYRELLGEQPGFAEAHFRLARLLEREGDWAGARRHFQESRDLDGMPQICTTPLQDACRAVGARHDAIVVDGPAVFRALLPDGILDDRLFHDAHHPTFRGYVALAQDVLNQLRARRDFGWPDGREAPVIDPDECAGHFKLGAAEWAAVCRYGGEWYEADAFIRHDPGERLARSRRCKAAADAISRGLAPEATGIPGLGLHPRLDVPAGGGGFRTGPADAVVCPPSAPVPRGPMLWFLPRRLRDRASWPSLASPTPSRSPALRNRPSARIVREPDRLPAAPGGAAGHLHGVPP